MTLAAMRPISPVSPSRTPVSNWREAAAMPAITPSPWASSDDVLRKSTFDADASAAALSSGLRLATSTRRSGIGAGASRGSAVTGSEATGATVSGCCGVAVAWPVEESRLSKMERSSGAPGLVSGMINP